MSQHIASQDGWIRIATGPAGLSVSGLPRHFKGYSCMDANGEDGVFARWEWNGRSLTARTCASGFLPLFYYADERQVVLSTRIEDIFTASGREPRPCPAALGLLLRLGFLVGDHTPFRDVKVLGPQGELAWEPGLAPVVRSSYPQAEPVRLSDAGLRVAYARRFRETMGCIGEAMGPGFAMPLSGGRDSRHIAIELYRMGRKPLFALTARHQAPRNNEDARIAAQLCKAMGWQHVLVGQPRKAAVSQELEHARATDFQSFEHAWTLPLRDALRHSAATQVFDGVGGDVLSAGLFQDEHMLALYRDGRTGALAQALLDKWSILGGEDGLAECLGEQLAPVRDPAPARALLEAELVRHLGQPNPLKSFYFWNRSRRGTGLLPFKIFSEKVAYAPYLHTPVRDFLLGLDPSATRDRTLHTDAIMLADESIGAIPYEDKRAPPAPRQATRAFHGELLACVFRSRGALRARFVAPRAARAFITGSEPHTAWWKPGRIAYIASLARFVNQSRATPHLPA